MVGPPNPHMFYIRKMSCVKLEQGDTMYMSWKLNQSTIRQQDTDNHITNTATLCKHKLCHRTSIL